MPILTEVSNQKERRIILETRSLTTLHPGVFEIDTCIYSVVNCVSLELELASLLAC